MILPVCWDSTGASIPLRRSRSARRRPVWTHHPPLLDHDALAETVLNQKTVYHFYARSAWTVVDTTE